MEVGFAFVFEPEETTKPVGGKEYRHDDLFSPTKLIQE